MKRNLQQPEGEEEVVYSPLDVPPPTAPYTRYVSIDSHHPSNALCTRNGIPSGSYHPGFFEDIEAQETKDEKQRSRAVTFRFEVEEPRSKRRWFAWVDGLEVTFRGWELFWYAVASYVVAFVVGFFITVFIVDKLQK